MNDLNYAALGRRIRLARKHTGLTQEQLSELCSMSAAHIGHIERGTRIPSIDTLYKISCGLGVSIDYLLMDSATEKDPFAGITDAISGKDKRKVKTFMAAVKALADNIDSL